MVVFKTKKWLEDEEFQEILKIADYMGYENGYKKFMFNISKAIKNGYFLGDVLNLIEDLGLEVEGSLKELEKEYSLASATIKWDSSRSLVLLEMPRSIYAALRRELEKLICGAVRELGEAVEMEIAPYKAREVVKHLKSLGIAVEDPQKLVAEKPLAIKPTLQKVELRPYQKEALSKWLENRGSGIIALPTGSGKSLIAVAAIVETSVKTLIVAYTKEQVYQWRDFILKYTTIPSSMIGLFYSEEKKLAPITISTYQSAFRNMGLLAPHFDMIVVDEVHHLPADKFKYIAYHNLARFKMGLSATPDREDGRHHELFPLLGGVVYYKTPNELVEQGYLAPYEVRTVEVELVLDERLEYIKLKKRIEELVKMLPENMRNITNARERFKRLLEEARRGNTIAMEILKLYSSLRMLVAQSRAKTSKAIELALREYENGNKVIVFTQYVDQAERIARETGGYLLTGEVAEQERKRILEEFKNLHRGILVVTTVGDEGIDIPDANVGIIVSGTGSKRQFVQRLGRLLRPKPGGQKAILYEIVTRRTFEVYQAARRRTMDLDELG